MSDKKRVEIIGAGVGGMAAANILAKTGYDVTVYEKNSEPGGRMGKLESEGFSFDTGPSWYLMKEVFEHYFGLFGKKPDDYYELVRLNPAYKVFFETRNPVTITDSLEQNLQVFESVEAGAAEALRKYIRSGETNYRQALQYFLYNNFNRPHTLINREVVSSLPRLLGIVAMSLHRYVSSQFKSTELQQILEYPSVFLGASPFKTPALYQLMSYLDFSEGVFYPKNGGMYSVTEGLYSLGKELGVQYKFDAEVEHIVTQSGRAEGLIVNGEVKNADIIVANSDLYHTEMQLLDKKDRSYDEHYWQKRKAGPSALLMYLGIKGSLPELEHHNLLFVKEWEKNFDDIYEKHIWPENASMYVSKTSATDKTTAPEGHENVFVLVPLPPGVTHSQEVTDEHVDKYLAQIEGLTGIHDLRERIVFKEVRTPDYFSDSFNSWQGTALGMSHTLKQSAFFRPSVKSKKLENLYYVGGGTQPGIGVPMCLISAQLVYKHLAQDGSPEAPTSIERLV